MDHNPLILGQGGNKGDPERSENLAAIENYRWQTRPAPLTEHESALAKALTEIFAADIWELDAVAAALNDRPVRPPGGGAWTGPALAAELARLAA